MCKHCDEIYRSVDQKLAARQKEGKPAGVVLFVTFLLGFIFFKIVWGL